MGFLLTSVELALQCWVSGVVRLPGANDDVAEVARARDELAAWCKWRTRACSLSMVSCRRSHKPQPQPLGRSWCVCCYEQVSMCLSTFVMDVYSSWSVFFLFSFTQSASIITKTFFVVQNTNYGSGAHCWLICVLIWLCAKCTQRWSWILR